MRIQEIVAPLAGAFARIAIGVILLLLAYWLALIVIDRLVPRLGRAKAGASGDSPLVREEQLKRIGTLQGLLRRLLRAVVVITFAVLVLDEAGQLELVAAVGVVVVTVLLAVQQVVLDYVMGFMILLEGPYHRGDWLRVSTVPTIEGEVLDVGLRKTVLRDADGAVNSVSNGIIRAAANFSRGFAVASTEITIIHAGDLEKALTISREIVAGQPVAGSGDSAAAQWDDPRPEVWITRLMPDGCTIRASRRVTPRERVSASSELRRSLVAALEAASIAVSRADATTAVALTQDERSVSQPGAR